MNAKKMKIKTEVAGQEESFHTEEPNTATEIQEAHSHNQHTLPPQISNMEATTLLSLVGVQKALQHSHQPHNLESQISFDFLLSHKRFRFVMLRHSWLCSNMRPKTHTSLYQPFFCTHQSPQKEDFWSLETIFPLLWEACALREEEVGEMERIAWLRHDHDFEGHD